jgi:hypothetical protein
VTSENATASAKRMMPAIISGSQLNISPARKIGQLRLEPMPTAGTMAVRSLSGA